MARKLGRFLSRAYGFECILRTGFAHAPNSSMNSLVEPSEAQIRKEIALIRRAAKQAAATPKSAAAFLKRIGAEHWPSSQKKKNGAPDQRGKR
jgi:hypothetical protein